MAKKKSVKPAEPVVLPKAIQVRIEDRVRTVKTEDYCRAVQHGLRDSFPSLSLETVRRQLSILLAGTDNSPNVIRMFMKAEVVVG